MTQGFRPRERVRAAHVSLLLALVATLVAGPLRAQDAAPFCPANLAPDLERCETGGTSSGTGSLPGFLTEPGAAPLAPLPSTEVTNPFDLATGTKRQSEIDFAATDGTLVFRRHYVSANADANVALGHGWRHSYQVELMTLSKTGGRHLIDARGRHLFFTPEASSGDAQAYPRHYLPALPSDGYLVERRSGDHVWVVPDGRRLTFRGSFLTRIDFPDDRHLSLYYRERRPVSITDQTGRRLELEYAPGQLDGLRHYVEPLGEDGTGAGARQPGHLAAVVLPDGRRLEYGYDRRSNLISVRHADGTARRYRYEDELWPNHLTGVIDRSGRTVSSWAYDERGRAVTFEDGDGGGRVQLAIDAPEDRGGAVGEIGTTTLVNANGLSSAYRWRRHVASGATLLLEATGAGCARCPPTGRRYAYTEGGALASATVLDDAGEPLSTRHYVYDGRRRLVRVEETTHVASPATRLLERREYDGDTHRVRLFARPSVNPDGEHVVETRFDATGLPVAVTERGWRPLFDGAAGTTPTGYAALERTTRIDRDRSGRVISIDGPREDVEDVARLVRDEIGRLTGIAPPAAPALRVTAFDALGQPLTLQLGERAPVELERDADGRLVRVRRGERTVEYGYDAAGRLVALTDTDGRTTRLTHDAAGRLSTVTDDLGRVATFEYDAAGRPIEHRELGIDGALIRSLSLLHDGRGEVREARSITTDADGRPRLPLTLRHERETTEDGQRLERIVNETSGAAIHLALDPIARVARLQTPDGAASTIALDSRGRTERFGDARGNATRRRHDDFGRVVLLDSPDTGRELFEHDVADNVVQVHHVETGEVSRYRYDAANRLLERRDIDGAVTNWRWSVADGTLAEAENGTTRERFAYDREARLVSHERLIDERRFVTGYDYDERGRLTEKVLPDGQRLVYHYHESGPNRGEVRAITRGRWFGLADDTVAGEIDLDARDGTAGHVAADGSRVTRRYGANGELTDLAIERAFALRYRFDEAGRIVGIDERTFEGEAGRGPNTFLTHRFDYRDGRLTEAEGPEGRTSYTYDALGNRLERTERDASGALVRAERHRYAPAGAGNRLLESVETLGGRVTDYRYAAGTGAPEAVGDLRYTYDARRRPVALHRGEKLLARYAYNAFGERVKKVLYDAAGRPTTRYFLYDGTTLTAEADADGRLHAQYVYLESHRPIARIAGRAVHAIHTDHRGAPIRMTDERGRVVWHADYTPFGEARLHRSDIPLPLRLPGQYADAESGTYYNYHRDYDPGTGRYRTSDPIGLAGGPNGYLYAHGEPLGGIDPLGLDRLTLGNGELGGLYDVADDALARGAITSEQHQQALEGILMVPKPAPDSEFVQKLGAVFSHAAHVLRTDPRYADRRLADLLESMAQAAPAIAGMVVLYSVVVAVQPQLAVAFAAAGLAFAGVEATVFFGKLIGFGTRTAGIDLCDAGGLNAIGDELAAASYQAGLDVVSGAVLGSFGAVATIGRRLGRPGRNPEGSTYEELEAAIEHELNTAAARADSPIKSELGVARPIARFDNYVQRGNLDPQVQRHVLQGERAKKGKMVGGHWAGSESILIDYNTAEILPDGAISAVVRIYDPQRDRFVKKSTPGGRSTLFPPHWSPTRILEEAGEASRSIDLKKEGPQDATSPSGMRIVFFVRDGKIQTFYPKGTT